MLMKRKRRIIGGRQKKKLFMEIGEAGPRGFMTNLCAVPGGNGGQIGEKTGKRGRLRTKISWGGRGQSRGVTESHFGKGQWILARRTSTIGEQGLASKRVSMIISW